MKYIFIMSLVVFCLYKWMKNVVFDGKGSFGEYLTMVNDEI